MTSVESDSFWQRSQSNIVDEILIKKILLSHDPDGRHIDSEILLSAAENIMFYATTSEASDKTIDENLESKISNIELIGSQEPLMHTINRIAHKMLSKCPDKGDLHTRTMVVFDLLGNYRWDVKVALALAAFATSYGEFRLLIQLRSHNPLADSVANFKQLPNDISMLKPQLKALRLLFKTMVDLTKCIIEFESLPVGRLGPDIDNLTPIKTEIYVTTYWIIRSTLVCASQITNLTADKPEQYSSIIIAAWELLSLDHRLSGIYSHLRHLLDVFGRQTEAKLHQKLVNLFMESHVDNQEVLQTLFALKDDLPFKDCSTQKKLGVSELRSKVVLLLISKPDLLPLEQLFFLVNRTYEHPNRTMVDGSYAIIWVPVSSSETWTDEEEKCFNLLSNSLPYYTVRRPWSLSSAVKEFIKQEWYYGDEALMVVLDSDGVITNMDALDMAFLWGSEAYPFSLSREIELWVGQQWTMQLMTTDIHPILTEWVAEGRTICIYGSENLDWIREFNAKMKDIRNAGVQLEMVYVGKNNPDVHVNDILDTVNREMHRNLLSFTKIQLFWFRLQYMKRSKSQLGNTASTDKILAEVLALLNNNDENGWVIFGKGLSADMIKVQGGKIIPCLNLFQQWGEKVAELDFIGALKIVLEQPLLRGPCNYMQFIYYSDGMTEGRRVCKLCQNLMKKYTIYE